MFNLFSDLPLAKFDFLIKQEQVVLLMKLILVHHGVAAVGHVVLRRGTAVIILLLVFSEKHFFQIYLYLIANLKYLK